MTFLSMVVVALLIVSVLPVAAQRGDDTNRVSKNGKVEGVIADVSVTVEYGRPMVKGREIWGGLVPFDAVWRTGADEATKITFSKDVNVEGSKLVAGTYSLFTIPGKTEWVVVFNKVAAQWGHYKYDKEQDALRVTVKPETTEMIEQLTFKIEGNKIIMSWEKLSIGFTISVAN